MSNVNDGGPAFPVTDLAWLEPKNTDEAVRAASGMTLRDYFAAKALPACYADYCKHAEDQGFVENWKMGVALDAYAMADAMLAARGYS